jgi:hypothetical protein
LYASFPIHYPSYAKYWIDVLNKTLKYGKVNNTAKVDIRRPIGAPVPITLEVSMKYYGAPYFCGKSDGSWSLEVYMYDESNFTPYGSTFIHKGDILKVMVELTRQFKYLKGVERKEALFN